LMTAVRVLVHNMPFRDSAVCDSRPGIGPDKRRQDEQEDQKEAPLPKV